MGIAVWLTAIGFANAGSSNSLLDVSPDSKRLLAANADNGTVTLVDCAKGEAVREIAVGAKPEGVTWLANGPLAAATLYGQRQVVVFDTETGQVKHRIATKAEPYGIVADKAGKRVFVSHEYPGVVSEIDTESGKVLREVPGGTMIRGIALAPDEKRVYVTEFHTGILNAIDLASGKIVDSWKGHTTDNLVRNVVLHPTRPKAYVPHIRSIVTVNDGDGSIFPQLTVCDLKPGPDKRRVSIGMDTFNQVYVVTNAWEAAISPDGKRFYLLYAGTNDMNYCNVVDDDYSEIERIGVARMGQNPRAIRVSPDNQAVYVYNVMDFSVAVHNPATMALQKKIKVCDPPKSPEWVRGKVLFNTSQPPMSARRWISCSSCHPDGGSDARAWFNPEGVRKTTAFFGMAHTHPLHWSADRDEVQDFEFTIRSRLMRGPGLMKGPLPAKVNFHKIELEAVTSGKSADLDALALYSNSFEPALSPHVDAPGKLTAEQLRGKELFFSKSTACATCHSGPYYSDSSLAKPFKLHDVGTGDGDPKERMGTAYDTPTLLGIYRSAPYLHHGKAKSLREVLTTYNPKDRHGKTSDLTPAQVDDLVAFLQALPYDNLPDATPNTVKFRFVPKK